MGRKCTRDWEEKYTRYGMCYSFNPDGGNDTLHTVVPEKVTFRKPHLLNLTVCLIEFKENRYWTKSSLVIGSRFQPIRRINRMVSFSFRNDSVLQ